MRRVAAPAADVVARLALIIPKTAAMIMATLMEMDVMMMMLLAAVVSILKNKKEYLASKMPLIYG